MLKRIKFGIRHNLFYLFMLILSIISRDIVKIIMEKFFEKKEENEKTDNSILLTLLMFLGEFLTGLILYKRHISFFTKFNKNSESTFKKIKLIHSPSLKISIADKDFVIYLLILASSSFDFLEFILTNDYLPANIDIFSGSLNIRIRCILVIFSSFFETVLLNIRILKHQKCSLITIIICLIIIIITEYFIIFNNYEKKGALNFTYYLLFIIINHLFYSICEVNEKYLLEYDYVNPFQMLMLEGSFGFIITFIYSLIFNKFKDIKYKGGTSLIFVIFIFLPLYCLLSGSRNAYRLITNKLYSPTTLALIYLIEDPFNILFYKFAEEDFKIKNKENLQYIYFLANLILSIIIVFCALIYNEFLIVFCFSLSHETHYEISNRAKVESQVEISEYENDDTL